MLRPLDGVNGVFVRVHDAAISRRATRSSSARSCCATSRWSPEERDPPSLVEHGVRIFGSAPREAWGRLRQLTDRRHHARRVAPDAARAGARARGGRRHLPRRRVHVAPPRGGQARGHQGAPGGSRLVERHLRAGARRSRAQAGRPVCASAINCCGTSPRRSRGERGIGPLAEVRERRRRGRRAAVRAHRRRPHPRAQRGQLRPRAARRRCARAGEAARAHARAARHAPRRVRRHGRRRCRRGRLGHGHRLVGADACSTRTWSTRPTASSTTSARTWRASCAAPRATPTPRIFTRGAREPGARGHGHHHDRGAPVARLGADRAGRRQRAPTCGARARSRRSRAISRWSISCSRRGQITVEQAKFFEHSNVILQALGVQEEVEVQLSKVELRRGDRLHAVLGRPRRRGQRRGDRARWWASIDDPAEAARILIEMANGAGGPDNITVIVAHVDGDGLPEATDDDALTFAHWRIDPEPAPPTDGESRPSTASGRRRCRCRRPSIASSPRTRRRRTRRASRRWS